MLVISSQDIQTGKIFDGQWTISNTVNGAFALQHFELDSGDIPFIYNGCKLMKVTDDVLATPPVDVLFTDQSDPDPAIVSAQLESDLNAQVPALTWTVTHDLATKKYTFSALTAFTIDWLEFGKVSGEQGSTLSVLTTSFSDYQFSRPEVFTMNFQETASSLSASNPVLRGDLLVPLNTSVNFHVDAVLSFNFAVTSLNISFFRLNVPGFSVPFERNWTVTFAPL